MRNLQINTWRNCPLATNPPRTKTSNNSTICPLTCATSSVSYLGFTMPYESTYKVMGATVIASTATIGVLSTSAFSSGGFSYWKNRQKVRVLRIK